MSNNLAISELKSALELDPENLPARYFLGQAIRWLIECDSMTGAESQWKQYFVAGAPLGHRQEVEQFLQSRRPVPR